MRSGFLVLNKEKSVSSNKVLSIIKKNCNIKKIGHFGTLDPLASGVLVVGINKATKLFDYFLKSQKEYIATITFGFETTTLDSEGEIVKKDNKTVSLEELKSTSNSFIKKYDQMPPSYSAKKVNGIRAYKLARDGKSVELKTKLVEIFDIFDIKKIEDNTYNFTVKCSSGTYIRSLVRDIAYSLNTVATMTDLVRTQCCNHSLIEAVDYNILNSMNIYDYLISFDKFLSNMPTFNIDKEYYKDILNGKAIKIESNEAKNILVYCKNELIGIGNIYDNSLKIVTYLHDSE